VGCAAESSRGEKEKRIDRAAGGHVQFTYRPSIQQTMPEARLLALLVAGEDRHDSAIRCLPIQVAQLDEPLAEAGGRRHSVARAARVRPHHLAGGADGWRYVGSASRTRENVRRAPEKVQRAQFGCSRRRRRRCRQSDFENVDDDEVTSSRTPLISAPRGRSARRCPRIALVNENVRAMPLFAAGRRRTPAKEDATRRGFRVQPPQTKTSRG